LKVFRSFTVAVFKLIICYVSESVPFSFLIGDYVLMVSFFIWAQRMLRRHFELQELFRLARRQLEAVHYHRWQDFLAGTEHSPHTVLGLYALARLHRTTDERRMLVTGTGYWQLYDIDDVARRMLDRQKSQAINPAWARIPDSAIPKLLQRMTELRRAEERTRDQPNIAALHAAYAAAVEANKRGDTSVLFFGAPLAPELIR
jgi:hypothetical protein